MPICWSTPCCPACRTTRCPSCGVAARGRQNYRPAQRLRDFVQARDGVCCFPTCSQPGYRCEFEHIVAFSEGGQTCRCGGALACRRHNLCRAGTGWQYRRLPDGAFRWTDDTGHQYTGHPPQRWAP